MTESQKSSRASRREPSLLRHRLGSKAAIAAAVGIALGAAGLVSAATPISGNRPVVVVLCNFSNQTQQPRTPAYFADMYSDAGAGELGALDYWKDVSYSKFSVTGTVVKGWYTLGVTRDAWVAMSRTDKWKACAEKAKPDVDYTKFAGAIVIFPEAETTLSAALNATDTTVSVTSLSTGNGANFPTPPFLTSVFNCCDANGNSINVEVVRVTAVSGNTFTVDRGQAGTTAVAHPNGSRVQVSGDLFGFSPMAVTLGGSNFTLGGALGAHDIPLSVMGHEEGHLFAINHSKAISQAPSDYSDCYDLMSTLTCAYTFTGAGTAFGGSQFGGTGKGPGLNSIQVDQLGWLEAPRKTTFDNSTCTQATYTMAALNHPEKGGFMQLRVPAVVPIPKVGGGTLNSDYYALELRSKTGWDRGIPADAFVLHLNGTDGYSYLVDRDSATLPVGDLGDGGLRAGTIFIDATRNVYVAVNSINAADFTGVVTVGGCRINATLTNSGATTGDYSDAVTLAGDLKVTGSGAPLPDETVTFTLGSQSCSGKTDANGRAACSLTLDQVPGSYNLNASFTGNAAYNPASGSAAFTITREDTTSTYTGPAEKDYHDAFTASGTLLDADSSAPIMGRTLSFTLGASDSCSAATGGAGSASCSITPSQVPAVYNMVTAFAGDTYYEPSSDTDSFTITKEETVTTYNGPTVILQGASGVTLSAQLLEGGPADTDGDGSTAPPVPSGQTVKLSLGSQSCNGVANASGIATCTLTFNGALGSQPLKAEFAGDAYYLPSSDTSKTAIVFAFPSRGAFTLGDATVAGAPPSTTLTWWSDDWWQRNTLTGGTAPLAFKGFAGTVTALPTTSPANVCGTTFTTRGGNSPPPTSGVPSYMGVLVASSVQKNGSTVSGTWAKIVVVRTDPGYDPSPGHPGTGTIVATFCG